MQRFDQSQRIYAESAQNLQHTMARFQETYRPELSDVNVETGRMMLEQLQLITRMQQEAAVRSEQSMKEVIHLLQEGFRLQDK